MRISVLKTSICRVRRSRRLSNHRVISTANTGPTTIANMVIASSQPTQYPATSPERRNCQPNNRQRYANDPFPVSQPEI